MNKEINKERKKEKMARSQKGKCKEEPGTMQGAALISNN